MLSNLQKEKCRDGRADHQHQYGNSRQIARGRTAAHRHDHVSQSREGRSLPKEMQQRQRQQARRRR